MKLQGFFYALLLFFCSCVGTDFIDDSDLTPNSVDTDDSTEVYRGEFSGIGNYDVEGTVTLYKNTAGELIVEFADDFKSSNGPGVYIYLTNSPESVGGGVELGAIKSNSGSQKYNVSMINSSVEINTYSHVLVHCKPFNVPFGYAALN